MLFEYDYAVVIGRFQPFHKGHTTLLNTAFKKAKKVICLLGSSEKLGTVKDPFTSFERELFIRYSIDNEYHNNLYVAELFDYPTDQEWVAIAKRTVVNKINEIEKYSGPTERRIALVGFHKDETSHYLKLFSDYTYIDIGSAGHFHSTTVREYLFKGDNVNQLHPIVAPQTFGYLLHWMKSDEYKYLQKQFFKLEEEKKKLYTSPYPINQVAVDTVVIHCGYVLLIKRKEDPGKDKWALPGGFVNTNETVRSAAIRELIEETNISLNPLSLKDYCSEVKIFDNPNRSSRGRVLSVAHKIYIPTLVKKPSIRPGDDAKEVIWWPLEHLAFIKDQLHEDHYEIIKSFVREDK